MAENDNTGLIGFILKFVKDTVGTVAAQTSPAVREQASHLAEFAKAKGYVVAEKIIDTTDNLGERSEILIDKAMVKAAGIKDSLASASEKAADAFDSFMEKFDKLRS